VHVPDKGVIALGDLFAARRGAPEWEPAPFGTRVRLYRNGRAALLSGLRAMGVAPGQRVWVPAFVCRAAIAPLRRCGLEACYYDITDALAPATGFGDARPQDLVLLIHYFGLAGPARAVREMCRARGLRFVEDCAHGLPDPASAMRMGAWGDLAIFSLRKQLPVPDGGVLVINDSAIPLPDTPGGARPGLGAPVRLAHLVAERLAFRCGWNILPLEDRLRPRLGADQEEDGAAVLPSTLTARLLAGFDLPALVRRKQAHYRTLAASLAGVRGVELPVPALPEGSVPQVLPVRVADPAGVCRTLRRMGVGAARWPGADAVQDLSLDAYPGARAWAAQGLCLPVNESLQPRHLDFVARALIRAVGA